MCRFSLPLLLVSLSPLPFAISRSCLRLAWCTRDSAVLLLQPLLLPVSSRGGRRARPLKNDQRILSSSRSPSNTRRERKLEVYVST